MLHQQLAQPQNLMLLVAFLSSVLCFSSDSLSTPSFSPEAASSRGKESYYLLAAADGLLLRGKRCRHAPDRQKSGGKYRKREKMHAEAASLDQCAADPSHTKKRLPGSANLEISSTLHRVQ